LEISQNSLVQTPVKAMGTKSRSRFCWPRFSESLKSSGPFAPSVVRVKSGAVVPTESAMMRWVVEVEIGKRPSSGRGRI